MFPAAAVANAILDKAQAESPPVAIDHMKLQKLVYITHGWHLAVTGEPLIEEVVYAWPYGPVIPPLYHQLKGCGARPIAEKIQF
jgi:uncharacterized phage-associated protein